MQKNYNLVKAMAMLLLLFIQNSLQAQNCCAECQTDVKMVSDKQVLLEKIDLKEGTTTTLNTNLYVSYRSGNAQKFWANLAIATAGVTVSTQLSVNSSAEGNNLKSVSPLIPLGVSVATLPSIWKNRPRGVPQAGLWLQHRDTRGRLTDTWEQPLSSEAKNSGELLSINIDKPLSAGTLEVYLQNGSKNPVYYWGYETIKSIIPNKLLPPKTPPAINGLGCPSGYLPNGQGMCCNPFNGDCVSEGGGNDGNPAPNPTPTPTPNGGCPSGYLPNGQGMCCRPGTNDCVSEGSGTPPSPNPTPTPNPVPQGCPAGYLPNGQGMCCRPGTNDCVSEGSSGGNNGGGNPVPNSTLPFIGCPDGYLPNGQGQCCKPGSNECVQEATQQNGKTWKKEVSVQAGPSTQSTQQNCQLIYSCTKWYVCNSFRGNEDDCHYSHTDCKSSLECGAGNGDSGNMPPVGTGGTTGGSGNTGNNGNNCVNGIDSNGNPCGRVCNTSTGYDQYGTPCGPSICGGMPLNPDSRNPSQMRIASNVDQYGHTCHDPETDVTIKDKCEGLRQAWANSLKSDGSVYKECHGFIYLDNGIERVLIMPQSNNTYNETNWSFGSGGVTWQVINGVPKIGFNDADGVFRVKEVIATFHTHPNPSSNPGPSAVDVGFIRPDPDNFPNWYEPIQTINGRLNNIPDYILANDSSYKIDYNNKTSTKNFSRNGILGCP